MVYACPSSARLSGYQVLLPLNEPTFGTAKKSQIQTFLEQNEGPGLQHIVREKMKENAKEKQGALPWQYPYDWWWWWW